LGSAMSPSYGAVAKPQISTKQKKDKRKQQKLARKKSKKRK